MIGIPSSEKPRSGSTESRHAHEPDRPPSDGKNDLTDIIYYYIREGSSTAGHRFRKEAEATFQRLASMPYMGSLYEHEHPALAGLRFFPLPSRFKKYLVFDRPMDDGIEVVRVLHGARDIEAIVNEEFGLGEEDGHDGVEEIR